MITETLITYLHFFRKRSEKCSVLDKLKRNGDCYLKCKRKNITEDRVKHNVTKKKDLDCE